MKNINKKKIKTLNDIVSFLSFKTRIKIIVVTLVSLMNTIAFSGVGDYCSPGLKDPTLIGENIKDLRNRIEKIFNISEPANMHMLRQFYPIIEEEYDEAREISRYLTRTYETDDISKLPTDPDELQKLKDKLKDEFDSLKKAAMKYTEPKNRCGLIDACSLQSMLRYTGLDQGFDYTNNPILSRYFKAAEISKEKMIEEMKKDGWTFGKNTYGVYYPNSKLDVFRAIFKKLFPNIIIQDLDLIEASKYVLRFVWDSSNDREMRAFINEFKYAKSSKEYHGVLVFLLYAKPDLSLPWQGISNHAINVAVVQNSEGELEVLLYGLGIDDSTPPINTEESIKQFKEYIKVKLTNLGKYGLVRAIRFYSDSTDVTPTDFFRK